jgi:hypothetical protein
MVFTTSTKFLTVDSASGISVGWFASGNTYDGTQEVLNINGNTLTMSGYPGGYPTLSGAITFSNSNGTLFTISPLTTKEFKLRYENATDTLGTWTSVLTINANQGTPVIKTVDNYVIVGQHVIYAPPLPDNRYDVGIAGSGGRTQREPGEEPPDDEGWTLVSVEMPGAPVSLDGPEFVGYSQYGDPTQVRFVYQRIYTITDPVTGDLRTVTETGTRDSPVLTKVFNAVMAVLQSLLGQVEGVDVRTEPIAVEPTVSPPQSEDRTNEDGSESGGGYTPDGEGGGTIQGQQVNNNGWGSYRGVVTNGNDSGP